LQSDVLRVVEDQIAVNLQIVQDGSTRVQ